MKHKIVALFLIFTLLLTGGFGCKGANKEEQEAIRPITLEYWRIFDNSNAFDEIIQDYQLMHPFITINYKKLLYEEYEKELLNALAEDRGPDIISLQSTWLQDYQKKLAPMPASIKMAYPIKKEVEIREIKSISLKELKTKFVDTVYDDVVLDIINEDGESQGKQIYGLPLAMDTMVMYYNKDLLNNTGIIEPPKYWNKSFQQTVKKLTKQNNKGQIIQSGVAMGETENIERSEDVLALLMMQNGSDMMSNGRVMFHQIPEGLSHHPGIGALGFYTDFSSPNKEVYCWNNTMKNSLDSFIQGNLAIMFGYAYHLPIIRTRAPKLNFEITTMPQIENNPIINYPNYWVETVSAKSKHLDEAWHFVQFMSTREAEVEKYLENTKKPTALRSLVEEQKSDIDIGVFAEQTLTAKNWYHGKNVTKMEEYMNEMIELAKDPEADLRNIIVQGANKVQQTVN